MASWALMPRYSADPIRPHQGSSLSNARLNFNAVGSLKPGASVSIWQMPPDPPQTPAVTVGGPGWLFGSGLNGGLLSAVFVNCFEPTTPLLINGFDSQTVGGTLWNRPTPPCNCILR